MRVLSSGGGPTQLSMHGGGFRSLEALVRQEMGLKRDPPRRGCGCPATPLVVLAVVLAVVLLSAVVRCDYPADGSTASGNGEASIAETSEFLPAEE